MQSNDQNVQLEGGKKRRGPCKSRSRSMCGNKGCSWHKGVYRGSNKRKGSCNAKPRMSGGESDFEMEIQGGESTCSINNATTCKASPGCVWRKSGGKGKKHHKANCAVKPYSYSNAYTGQCNPKNMSECKTDAACQYVKGNKSRKGYCKNKRFYGSPPTSKFQGMMPNFDAMEDAFVPSISTAKYPKLFNPGFTKLPTSPNPDFLTITGGKKSRKGKGPCKSRTRSTCGHKGCVFKKSSSRAKAHCSAKGGK